ncbi:hypothetical protein FYK55_15035 [Roseiconus nitratireducens]|uniref:Uncharacterized protein n=1 Tax=Roseiconus nitratireducens TaxID=2605748 RepID=A0A5M6D3Q3_9BACT|nr:hypothetical protein [Roseiconus nitratireducens]KAA5542121.1 hypothetical protein FYK55_15035 [Roseiconus nitratireducens]
MRNIIKLVTANEICSYVRDQLLQTEVLRRSYDQGGLVASVLRRFARLPRFFYQPSADTITVADEGGGEVTEFIESPHFSPWWGGIQLRDYENKLVQDLYYLHEIEHAGTMPYGPDTRHSLRDPVTFKNKIRDNEHEASTLSEMTIYCEFPELRKHSFAHEIFVDRFLFCDGDFDRVNVRMLQRWRDEPDLVKKEMMYARAAVLTGPKVSSDDLAAYWLKRFYSQGREWTKIWTNPKGESKQLPRGGRFALVESAMVRFREQCEAAGREAALDEHLGWLRSSDVTGGTEVPFFDEARAFCESYLRHKLRYFESLRNIGKQTETHYTAAKAGSSI